MTTALRFVGWAWDADLESTTGVQVPAGGFVDALKGWNGWLPLLSGHEAPIGLAMASEVDGRLLCVGYVLPEHFDQAATVAAGIQRGALRCLSISFMAPVSSDAPRPIVHRVADLREISVCATGAHPRASIFHVEEPSALPADTEALITAKMRFILAHQRFLSAYDRLNYRMDAFFRALEARAS